MRIVVFGANGPTGRLLTAQALAQGHTVTAVTRKPDSFPIRHARLTVVHGDVYDGAAVDRAVVGHDAVLSTLGVPYSRRPIRVYSEGIANIMAAMGRHGVRRLVCVSSSATDPGAGPHGGFLLERVLQPILIGLVGRTLYADMARMEAMVTASDLDWTIMRPSGLFETAEVTDYAMSEDYLNGSFTSRADLASSILRQLDSDEYVRKIVAVATFASKPSLMQLVVREGLSKKA